jgi:hypothetical protein
VVVSGTFVRGWRTKTAARFIRARAAAAKAKAKTLEKQQQVEAARRRAADESVAREEARFEV